MKKDKKESPHNWLVLIGATIAIISWASVARAFSVPVHLTITKELEDLTAVVDSRTVKFSERAIEQIKDANEGVDSITAGSAALFRPERHFTNEEFKAATQRLIDLRAEVLELVRMDRPDGKTARQRLGQALHTVQDFYSHGTWVELGRTEINTAFGTSTNSDPALAVMPCTGDPSTAVAGAGGAPSSAYFVGGVFATGPIGCNTEELPAGKCFHGNYTMACIGINKDLTMAESIAEAVPFNPLHPTAVNLAETATRTYVREILDELSGEDKALQALLNIPGSFGFIIDDTGSMGPEIAGVRSVVRLIVDSLGLSPIPLASDFTLVTFGDPTVDPAFVTTEAGALLSAVDGISPSGGGDCPELSMGGLLEGIDAALNRSVLFLFTDASSKDSGIANLAIARAQEKEARVIYALSGSCSPFDPSYFRVAEETGGQVFALPAAEVPLLFDLIEPKLSGDQTLLGRTKGDLGSGATKSIAVPVDSTVSGLQISVSVDVKSDVRLRRPSGDLVNDGEPGVVITELSSGCIVSVADPEAGEWKLEVEGSGQFSAVAEANSPIQFGRFDFVRRNGDEDVHGGFFPISGRPIAGSEGIGEATLFGFIASAEFILQDELGEVVDTVVLSKNFPRAAPTHYLGTIDLPSIPFRVAATGLDENGFAYQRLYPVVFRAQTVSLEVSGMQVIEVAQGGSAEISYVVTNLGSAASFNTAAVDDLGFVSSVEPPIISLANGESAEILVGVEVDADSTGGETSNVTLTVTQVGNVDAFNSATTVINVLDNQRPDCSAASDTDIVFWPPNHKMKSVDIETNAGAVDPDGDTLSYEVLAITQDEPVDGAGSGNTAPDGTGIGESVAEVRAERAGGGNGRVYALSFQASDGQGGSCDGSIRVSVPKSRGNGSVAVDDGQVYDSTGG